MERGRRKSLLLIGTLLLVTTCAYSPARSLHEPAVQGPSIIPLSVHYLTDERDIRTKLEQSLEESNATLTPHGIALTIWSEDRVYRMPGKVATMHDRQILGSRVEMDGTLHIFVVDEVSLKPGDDLNGLHTSAGKRDFVILSKTARDTTLAHEVGHALGLNHEGARDNVMCTGREEKDARFTADQGDVMRTAARQLVVRDWR